MSLEPILARLQTRIVLADGAMGTWLLSTSAVTSCVELLNVASPDVVGRAHRDYLAAGAQLIETNTFAGNRIKLAKHESAHRLQEINAAGVRIARDTAAGRAYVAGSIGPLGALLQPLGVLDKRQARDIFEEHIAAVVAGGPDALLLETFGDVNEALLALEAARAVARMPTIVSLSVLEDGKTPGGDPLSSAFARLRAAGADGVGVNCAAGPQVVFNALEPVIGDLDCPVSVMPNAGYPERIDDRAVYRSTPVYFAEFARKFAAIGANIIGGCCGTTPAHIKSMAVEVSGKPLQPRPESAAAAGLVSADAMGPAVVGPATRVPAGAPWSPLTNFERKLGREFVIAVELVPPRGIDVAASLERARRLEQAGADAVNIPDNPTARLRLSSVALAHLVQRETRLATILHFSSRDRNLLALQSELLGAAALGVTGILALTGDPNTFGDFPKATSVFDVTAVGLTEILNALNHGKDHAGNELGSASHFRIGAAVNAGAKDLDAELARLSTKIDAGADFAITQPVFDVGALGVFLERARPFGVPIIAGVLVLRGAENAEFLHNEVPGVTVPEDMRKRLRAASDDAEAGLTIAGEILRELRQTAGVAGAFILPQDRYRETADIVRALRATATAAS